MGRAPASPGGYSEATTAGLSYGPEASADYDALLRDFDAADAAGKEAILFRELMLQQQEGHTGAGAADAGLCEGESLCLQTVGR